VRSLELRERFSGQIFLGLDIEKSFFLEVFLGVFEWRFGSGRAFSYVKAKCILVQQNEESQFLE